MTTDHILAALDGQACEVYFFESWTSYAHPVTPVDPIDLEDALLRGKYQRAWMCRSQGAEPRFVLIETIDNQSRTLKLPEGAPTAGPAARFFEARGSAEHPELGAALKADDVAAAKTFIAVLPAPAAAQPLWVTQKVLSSFRYRYRDDGALASVTITNPEGKVNVLDY
jgi:hypothetical protein